VLCREGLSLPEYLQRRSRLMHWKAPYGEVGKGNIKDKEGDRRDVTSIIQLTTT
jgi:hypothetical protein